MCPQSVPCDRCGQTAAVIEATPIYDDAEKLRKADGRENAAEYSCRVECRGCGIRIQIVRIAGT